MAGKKGRPRKPNMKPTGQNGAAAEHVSDNDLDEKCFVCDKTLCDSDEALQCDCCEFWHHRVCEHVHEDDYKFLSSTPNLGIRWYCGKCNKGIVNVMNAVTALQSRQEKTERRVAGLEKGLETATKKIEELFQKGLETAAEKVDKLANRDLELDAMTKKVEEITTTFADVVKGAVSTNISDRMGRKKNVVIFGLIEPDAILKEEVKRAEYKEMQDIYKTVTETEINVERDLELMRMEVRNQNDPYL